MCGVHFNVWCVEKDVYTIWKVNKKKRVCLGADVAVRQHVLSIAISVAQGAQLTHFRLTLRTSGQYKAEHTNR